MLKRDPASFRDPSSTLSVGQTTVSRIIRGKQAAVLAGVIDRESIKQLMADRDLIAVIDETQLDKGEILLTHPLLKGITYPFEWSFEMLKAAALLHLKVHKSLLEDELTLRDGSSYNIAFQGCQPIFIDFGSIGEYQVGENWSGFSQFCSLFLYPLMISSYLGVDHRRFLQSSVDGLTVDDVRKLIPASIKYKRGRFRYVVVPSLLESRMKHSNLTSSQVEMPKKALIKMLTSLEKFITTLDSSRLSRGVWSDYTKREHYERESLDQKIDFVRQVCSQKRRHQVWDLGANDCLFSRIAADYADQVLAVDLDAAVVDRNFQEIRSLPQFRHVITPAAIDLKNATNGLGWIGGERMSLADRFSPDLTLYLAVAHHVGITAHVPLEIQLEFIFRTSAECVFELPLNSDPKVIHLARNMKESHIGQFVENYFESRLPSNVKIALKHKLNDHRVIYHLVADRS